MLANPHQVESFLHLRTYIDALEQRKPFLPMHSPETDSITDSDIQLHSNLRRPLQISSRFGLPLVQKSDPLNFPWKKDPDSTIPLLEPGVDYVLDASPTKLALPVGNIHQSYKQKQPLEIDVKAGVFEEQTMF